MTDRLSPERIATDMDRVHNSADANRVTQELLESTRGMSMNETLAFLRQVRAAHHQGQGEDLSITLDMNHAHLVLTSPYTSPQHFELTDD